MLLNPVFTAGEKVANHLFSLRSVEILAFPPLRGTPSSRHVPPSNGKAFDRSSKVGVVKSGVFSWGTIHFLEVVCTGRCTEYCIAEKFNRFVFERLNLEFEIPDETTSLNHWTAVRVGHPNHILFSREF